MNDMPCWDSPADVFHGIFGHHVVDGDMLAYVADEVKEMKSFIQS